MNFRVFFVLLFLPAAMLISFEVEEPDQALTEVDAVEVDQELFELQRQQRRHRLWGRHYDREAKRILAHDAALHQKWLRRAEENFKKSKDLQRRIFALEEQRLQVSESEDIFR